MPCLINFDAFSRNRRYHIARYPDVRAAFLEQVLAPLAALSTNYTDVLHSWDLINEPGWNLIHPSKNHRSLGYFQIRAFLQHGLAVIDAAAKRAGVHIDTTVGHGISVETRCYPTGSIPQFHHYPLMARRQLLAGSRFSLTQKLPLATPDRPALVGEMSSNAALPTTARTPPIHRQWPELDGADVGSEYAAVLQRLWLLERHGYRQVLLWYTRPGDLPAHRKYTPDVWRAVDDFHQGIIAQPAAGCRG